MLAWLKLIRLPNLPTAIANVLAGFLLVNQSWSQWPQLLLLIISSAVLYSAGMVLNDVFDVAQDTDQRPQRPIPSGQISLATARGCGLVMLLLGMIAAISAGAIAGTLADVLKCATVSGLLALSIYLYDGPFKRTVLAPILMGVCRSLNIMLGGATATTVQVGYCLGGFPIILWAVAFAIGLFITGVTLLARNESASRQSRFWISVSSVVIVAGVVVLAAAPQWHQGNLSVDDRVSKIFPFMIAMISVTIIRRLALCIIQPNGRSVKYAVIASLRSLIVFDAAICFLARPDQLVYALIVLALLVPVLVLSRWMYAT